MIRRLRKLALQVTMPVMSLTMALSMPNTVLADEFNVVTDATLRDLFDEDFYAAMNPDVVAVYGDTEENLWLHFTQYGMYEGRAIDDLFDVHAYHDGNEDLREAFGDNWEEYLKHYFQYGLDEIIADKRSKAGMLFNPAEYAMAYRDVFAVYGNNWQGIMWHYLTYGRDEGRTIGWVQDEVEEPVQTLDPPIAAQTPTGDSGHSYSGGSSSSGGSGGSSSSGGSGGSSSSTPRHDVTSTHTLADFVGGKCKYGCGLTLADFQKTCIANGENHMNLAEGSVCDNCGYNKPVVESKPDPKPDNPQPPNPDKPGTEEPGPDNPGTEEPGPGNPGTETPDPSEPGTDVPDQPDQPDKPDPDEPVKPGPDEPGIEEPNPEEPGPEEPKQHVHIWVDGVCFGEGECPGCPNADNHENVLIGEACSVCGKAGEKAPVATPSEPEKPDKPDPDQPDTEEPELPAHTQEECPDKAEHGSSWVCPVCGAEGTKVPVATPSEPEKPDKPDQPDQPDQPDPDKPEIPDPDEPEHVHDWSNQDGTCAGEGECPGCPEMESHADLLVGEICGVCGLAGTKEPEVPDPDEPEGHPEGYEHVKTDFDLNGKCTTVGCTMTLEEFQASCKVDHAEIPIGEYCEVCGAEGTKASIATPSEPEKPDPDPDQPDPDQPDPDEPEIPDPDEPEGHPEGYVHELADFDSTGKCTTVGCTMTLEEFQENCEVDHAEIPIGEYCSVCGAEGTKVPVATPSEPEKPKDPCADGHDWSDGTGYCTRCGKPCPKADTHDEVFEEHYCEICGFEGSRHEWSDGICIVCGQICPNTWHGHLEGVACEICGYVKPVTDPCADGHDWSDGTGYCARCNTACPKIDLHVELAEGKTCGVCGYTKPEEPKEPEGHPENYIHKLEDFGDDGKCTAVGCALTLEEFQRNCEVDHTKILKGEYCSTCGAEGTMDQTVEEHEHTKNSFNADGMCKTEGCDVTLEMFQGICKHSQIVGDVCTTCGAVLEEVCIDADEHHLLHKGQHCEACGAAGITPHKFVAGVCECGAIDENYVAVNEDDTTFDDLVDDEMVEEQILSSEEINSEATEDSDQEIVSEEQIIDDEVNEELDDEESNEFMSEAADKIDDEESEEIAGSGEESTPDSDETIEDDRGVINGDEEESEEVDGEIVQEESHEESLVERTDDLKEDEES